MASRPTPEPPPPLARAEAEGRPLHAGRGRLASWLFGLALLVTLVLVASRWSEGRDFAALLVRARPRWLLLAVLLQAATYLAQGGLWAAVLLRAGCPVPLGGLYRMSVAKRFIDQALPSAGVGGAVLVLRGLERRGIARGPAMACIVVEALTNPVAFSLGLLLALGMAAGLGVSEGALWGSAAGLILLSAGMLAPLLVLSRGRRAELPRWLARLPGVTLLVDALAQTPPDLAHRPRLLAEGTVLNLLVHLLDAATLWALLHAVGAPAPPTGVYASFMLSTLARVLGVVPGGLGAFEAASFVTLRLLGVPDPAALAATLLFRGLNFFVPLLPGLLLARAELRRPAVQTA